MEVRRRFSEEAKMRGLGCLWRVGGLSIPTKVWMLEATIAPVALDGVCDICAEH